MLLCRSRNEKLTEDCRVAELQSFPSSVLHHVNDIFFRQRRSISKQLGANAPCFDDDGLVHAVLMMMA